MVNIKNKQELQSLEDLKHKRVFIYPALWTKFNEPYYLYITDIQCPFSVDDGFDAAFHAVKIDLFRYMFIVDGNYQLLSTEDPEVEDLLLKDFMKKMVR